MKLSRCLVSLQLGDQKHQLVLVLSLDRQAGHVPDSHLVIEVLATGALRRVFEVALGGTR